MLSFVVLSVVFYRVVYLLWFSCSMRCMLRSLAESCTMHVFVLCCNVLLSFKCGVWVFGLFVF